MARQPGDSDFTNCNATIYKSGGTQVVTTQQAAIADVSGASAGAVADGVNSVLAVLRTHGLIAT